MQADRGWCLRGAKKLPRGWVYRCSSSARRRPSLKARRLERTNEWYSRSQSFLAAGSWAALTLLFDSLHSESKKGLSGEPITPREARLDDMPASSAAKPIACEKCWKAACTSWSSAACLAAFNSIAHLSIYKEPIIVINGLGTAVDCVGKRRLILDARYINLFDEYHSFSYESLADVPQHLKPDDFLMLTDLKSGYHQVRMHPRTHIFLGI